MLKRPGKLPGALIAAYSGFFPMHLICGTPYCSAVSDPTRPEQFTFLRIIVALTGQASGEFKLNELAHEMS
jgi:hypothetical protein